MAASAEKRTPRQEETVGFEAAVLYKPGVSEPSPRARGLRGAPLPEKRNLISAAYWTVRVRVDAAAFLGNLSSSTPLSYLA